jgi:hypothetical protein
VECLSKTTLRWHLLTQDNFVAASGNFDFGTIVSRCVV